MEQRYKVLNLFRTLHRTRKLIFREDDKALEAAKQKINAEFRKNLTETSPEKITQLLKLGSDVEVVLRTSIIQGVHIDDNKILLRPTKEVLQDNIPFQDTPRKDA